MHNAIKKTLYESAVLAHVLFLAASSVGKIILYLYHSNILALLNFHLSVKMSLYRVLKTLNRFLENLKTNLENDILGIL